jgi:hypothetical protein
MFWNLVAVESWDALAMKTTKKKGVGVGGKESGESECVTTMTIICVGRL